MPLKFPRPQPVDEPAIPLSDEVRKWNEWRQTPEANGKRPSNINLSGESFANEQLEGIDWSEAKLCGADLSGTNLRHANLRGADLTGANLNGTDLKHADLNDAILVDVDFSTAKGLLPHSLAGTDLTGAKNLGDLGKFEGMSRIDELSKNTGALFVSMMAACAYCWLTIGSTKDLDLVLNSGTSKLPVIQTEIPIVAFYWLAPFVLLGIFLYFHLYLQRLWEAMARLPAIFPDGVTADHKTYAWLLNDLVRAYMKHLQLRREPMFWLQRNLSLLLAYFLLPLTLFCLGARYIVRHEWIGTGLQLGALALAMLSALGFHHLAKITIGRDTRRLKMWAHPLRYPRRFLWHCADTGIVVLLLGIASLAIMSGTLDISYGPFHSHAILAGAEISKKPDKWDGHKLENINGAQLGSINLTNADAMATFMDNANLFEANLKGAKLEGANLKGADLQAAHLEKAQLEEAHLEGVTLGGAYLNDADFDGTLLNNADLSGVDLSNARNLTVSQIVSAHYDEFTQLPDDIQTALQQLAKQKKATKNSLLASKTQARKN